MFAGLLRDKPIGSEGGILQVPKKSEKCIPLQNTPLSSVKMLLLLMLCNLLTTTFAADHGGKIVQTSEGLVRGSIMTSFRGRQFWSYRGIPYAEPPTGFRRFKPPQPKSSWSGVLNVTTDGSVCPQIVIYSEEYVGNEDCLFLNVYSPVDSKNNPVIIWIHGGGFIFGHGGISLSGPEYLMDHDVILVTFNYRLGPLGFLSTGDSAISGNFGMKDAVEVLRWVQRNIEAFGGNRDAVTVFGYSSGAANAHSLTMSPLSKGLFHRVIFESGSALHHWAFKSSPLIHTQKVAELTGCQLNDTSDNIAKCLTAVPTETLIRTLYSFPYWAIKMPLPYGLVAEGLNDPSDPPFLTQSPLQLIQKGQVHRVSAITGVTAAENTVVPYLITQSDKLASELEERFDEIVLRDFLQGKTSREVVEKVRKFYFGDIPIKEVTLQHLVRLFSDVRYNYNTFRAALAHSRATNMPVYVYKFSFEGRLSSIVIDKIHSTPLGVIHADDLFYVFGRGVNFPGGPNEEEKRTIQRVTKMLSDFALTGNPTPTTDNLISVKWLPLDRDKKQFRYLEIGKELSTHHGPIFSDRMAFWDSLLAKNSHDEL